MIATNIFDSVPEFYYLDNINVNFLEGYDKSLFAVPTGSEGTYYCIVSSDLMDDHEIVLGDTIRVSPFLSEGKEPVVVSEYARPGNEPVSGTPLDYYDLMVVGSYEQQSSVETIYVPLPLLFDTSLIWDPGSLLMKMRLWFSLKTRSAVKWTLRLMMKRFYSYRSPNGISAGHRFIQCNFQIPDSRDLTELKDYLIDYGYSQVNNIGRYRTFIVIDDAVFNNAVAGLKQQIRYTNTLYPFLYVLVGVIAFVVSYLLVVSRRMELAILRGLGATSLTTFMSFFMEQSLLCLLGLGVGLAAWQLLRGTPIDLHLWLVLGFIGCYFIGSGLSIAIMNKRNLLTILSDKD